MNIHYIHYWRRPASWIPAAVVLAVSAAPCHASEATDADKAALAKKLANPIAALISVPFQYNYDQDFGPEDDGSVSKLNIQPVIPASLNEDWNLITRVILPLVDQDDIPVKGQGESGLGDTVTSLFFSPKAPTSSGWIWGAGPVLLLPTASDDSLGAEKWGLGPTAVALKQSGPWTVGALANHIWSVAGEGDRDDVNATFLQPFVSYITQTKTTFGISSESTYDWENESWSVPVNATVAQMLKVGPQILQVTIGARYWLDAPDYGPEGWGIRLQLTLLYPK